MMTYALFLFSTQCLCFVLFFQEKLVLFPGKNKSKSTVTGTTSHKG